MKLTLLRLVGHLRQTLAQQSPSHSLHLPGPQKGLSLISHLSSSIYCCSNLLTKIYIPVPIQLVGHWNEETETGLCQTCSIFCVYKFTLQLICFFLPLGEFQGNSVRWDKDLLIYKTNVPINIFEFWVPSEASLSPWCLNFRESKSERNGIDTNSLCLCLLSQ